MPLTKGMLPNYVSPDATVRVEGVSWRTWTDEDGELLYVSSRLRPVPIEDIDCVVADKIRLELRRIYEN